LITGEKEPLKRKRHYKMILVASIIVLAAVVLFIWLYLHSESSKTPSPPIIESTPHPVTSPFAVHSRVHRSVNPMTTVINSEEPDTQITPLAKLTAGEPVSANLARKAAEIFLQAEKNRRTNALNDSVNLQDFYVSNTEAVVQDGGYPLAYVHNLSPTGFIITSGHTSIRPVVGFSFKGSFSFQDSADNVLLHLLRADMKARAKALSNGAAEPSIQSNIMQWTQYKP